MTKTAKAQPRTVVDAFRYLRRELTLLGAELLLDAGLGAKQATALVCLKERGAVTMSELAEEIQSDNAAATRIAISLEAMGLIKRTPSTTDRRQTLMQLTAKGLRKAPVALGVYDEVNRRIGGVLTKQDQRDLVALMDRLSDALRDGRATSPAPAPKKKR